MELQVETDGSLQVPAEICRALGWEPGAPVVVDTTGGRLAVRPAASDTGALAGLKERIFDFADSMRQAADAPPRAAASRTGGPPAAPGGLLPFQGELPTLGARCYVAPGATVIGKVSLGEDCSVWPGVVLRGDVNGIQVGARTNIQDGAVVHANPGDGRCRIGSGVTVGHQATVHACDVEDGALIGIHAVVLDGARIGAEALIAAGAVVTPGTVIPPRTMAIGIPARAVRDLTSEELEHVRWHADAYVSLKDQYLSTP